MGRKKIEIQRIEGERHRQVTYSKRKMGMIKKATELAVLTDAQVGLIAFGSNGKMTVYSSAPLEHIIERYRRHTEAPEVRSRARPHRTICTDCREKRGDPHTLLGYLSAHHFVARAQVFTNEHYFREKRKKEGIEQEGDDESDEAEEGADDPRLQAPAHVQYAAHQRRRLRSCRTLRRLMCLVCTRSRQTSSTCTASMGSQSPHITARLSRYRRVT